MVFDALTLRRAPYALRHIHKKARSHPSRRMKAGLPQSAQPDSCPPSAAAWATAAVTNGYRYASGTQDYRKLPFDCAQDERALGWKTAHLRSA